jgi:hypothetical protein
VAGAVAIQSAEELSVLRVGRQAATVDQGLLKGGELAATEAGGTLKTATAHVDTRNHPSDSRLLEFDEDGHGEEASGGLRSPGAGGRLNSGSEVAVGGPISS